MKNLEVGQFIEVVNQEARDAISIGEMLFGEAGEPELEGIVVAVNPSVEEYSAISEDFSEIAEHRGYDNMVEALKNTVVYYDEGAERHFIIPIKDVELIDEDEDTTFWFDGFDDEDEDTTFWFDGFDDEDEEPIPASEVKVGDYIKATGLGSMFTQLVGGEGQGRVVHVAGDEIDEDLLDLDIPETHFHMGILYYDERADEILWVAEDDFEIIA